MKCYNARAKGLRDAYGAYGGVDEDGGRNGATSYLAL